MIVKMKGLIFIAFVLLLISFSFISNSGNVLHSQEIVGGKTLYVGGSGDGNYTSIQAAIDDAENGDTIFVYDDSSPYYENVVINKSILLIGENKETTIIDGMGKKAIIIKADDSEVKNFTVRNCTGIRINGNFNKICNNIITSGEKHAGSGVYINDKKHGNTICNNTISGYSRGESSGVLLRYESYDCYILNNSIYQCEYAVLVNGIGYSIIGNDIENSDFGMYIASFGKKQCFVMNNSISDVKQGIILGSGTPLCYIEHNIIINSTVAIGVTQDAKNAVIKNNAVSNGYYGIRLTSFNSVIKNEIDGFIYGVEALGHNNTVIKNNFVGNTRNAVFMAAPNKWDENYWYNWRLSIPKPIFGMTGKLALIPWMEFDFHPAKEPWKIGGER